MSETAPFGALAPAPAQERVRRLAHRLPANWLGRKAASLLLGPAGRRARRGLGVRIFYPPPGPAPPAPHISALGRRGARGARGGRRRA